MCQLGSLRIGNKRKASRLKPRPDEIEIHVDRTHPVLGNPFILTDPNDDAERERVLEAYRHNFEQDWAIQGPKYFKVMQIAQLVLEGKNVILMCWCAPKRCHAEIIRDRVLEIIRTKKAMEVEKATPCVIPPGSKKI